MDKFAKFSAQKTDILAPLVEHHAAEDALTATVSNGDPLVFVAMTDNRYPYVVDLTRYRDGRAKLGLIGFPNIIAELLPSIRRGLGDGIRSRGAIHLYLAKNVSIIFRWLSWLSVESGPNALPRSVTDFSNADGVLLKRYLLSLGGIIQERRKQLGTTFGLIESARREQALRQGMDLEPLFWPTIEVEEDRFVHPDVDPDAVKQLYHTCKRVIEQGMARSKMGRDWLGSGIDPRTSLSGDGKLQPSSRQDWGANSLWRKPTNLFLVARAWIEDRVVGTSFIGDSDRRRLFKHTNESSGDAYCGMGLRQLYAAAAPSSLEVTAAALIVSMETGWIDSVSRIDLKSEWYIFRRGVGVDNAHKLDSVLLQAVRPKTGRKVRAIGQAGSRFRTYQIIRNLEQRTGFLRELLVRRRAVLAAQPESVASLQEIAQIDEKVRSPWLWFNGHGRGVAACGQQLSLLIHEQLPILKRLAIAKLPANRPDREQLAYKIQSLVWSDMRDAFATHIYENSGQNLLLVQRALSHSNPFTTRSYLRQRRQLRSRFDSFRTLIEKTLSEIQGGRSVDPTILYLSSNYHDFDNYDRDRLRQHRTRMGMGCGNPTDPEEFLSPRHPADAICTVQRCILCRHGILLAHAFEGLADRHADLLWLRENTPTDRWMTSTFWWELEAVELALATVFKDKQPEVAVRLHERLAGLRAKEYFVFDDPNAAAGGL